MVLLKISLSHTHDMDMDMDMDRVCVCVTTLNRQIGSPTQEEERGMAVGSSY